MGSGFGNTEDAYKKIKREREIRARELAKSRKKVDGPCLVAALSILGAVASFATVVSEVIT